MCHLFCVMCLPFVVSWIVYDLLWWLWSSMLIIIPWVHSLPSSQWTATADPIGIYGNTVGLLLSFLCCLSMSLPWWSSSRSCPMGLQSRTGIMPQTCLLNSNVARLGKPGLNGVVHICNRAMFMSLPDSAYFLNVCFINVIQASTCLLLWWWYANDIACFTLTALQNCRNLSETKFVPVSWHYFLGYTIFHEYYLNCIGEVLGWQSFQSLDNGKFAVVIYNTQVIFIIKMEYVCPSYLPWLERYVMMYYPFLRLCLLKCKTGGTLFYVFFDISIYAGPVQTFKG